MSDGIPRCDPEFYRALGWWLDHPEYKYVIRKSDWNLHDVQPIDMRGEFRSVDFGCDEAGWPLRDGP